MSAPLGRSREVLAGLAAAVAGVGLVVGLGLADWPGQPFDCSRDACFCELPRPGLVRQVSNTWSNLGAVLLGLLVAGRAARHRQERARAGRPDGGADLVGLLFPVVLVFQGVGSMLFHGGLTVWGSALDGMSMFATVGLLVATNLHRLGRLGPRGMLALFAGMMAAGVGLGFVSQAAMVHSVFVLFFVILGTETALSHTGRVPSPGFFRAGLAVYLVGSAVWFLSGWPGLPLCSPASPWQGHALWHLTAAGGVALFALHAFRNLDRCPGRPRRPAPRPEPEDAEPDCGLASD